LIAAAALRAEERNQVRHVRGKPLLLGALLGLLLMLLAEVLRVFLGSNFHTVVPHHCYRCGQPTPSSLAALVHALHIRTVINLRGWQIDEDEELWFRPEVDAAAALGVKLVHISLSAYTPPSAQEFRALIRALDEGPEPILLHCHSGSDRSGLASATYLLLKTDTPLEEARWQIHWRFGHNPWGGAACQRLVLGQYADWLRAHGCQHTPAAFRRWACEEYRE
jgi:protein tyrosine phosphatase (PTP) superfamily phosphohydrolase (DUF442 family)